MRSQIAFTMAKERVYGGDTSEFEERVNSYLAWNPNCPMGILTFYNAIANDGKMVKLVSEGEDGVVLQEQIAEPQYVGQLQKGLEQCVSQGLMRKAVMENAETKQDQEAYAKRYEGYVAKYEKLKKRYADAQEERQARQNKAQILDGMIDGLRGAGPVAIGFDEKLWNATVDHVTVSRDGSLVFTMRDGREIRVKR